MKERDRAREREEREEIARERENLWMKRIQTVLENHCLHLSLQTDTERPSATRMLQLSSSPLPSIPPSLSPCPGRMDLSKDEAKLVCKLSEWNQAQLKADERENQAEKTMKPQGSPKISLSRDQRAAAAAASPGG